MNAMLAVINRLTKERHYIPCDVTDEGTTAEATTDMMVREVFRLHGLPASVISDRGPRFVSKMWKTFCKRLRIKAKLSTAFHPQTDGQTERFNQEVERHLEAARADDITNAGRARLCHTQPKGISGRHGQPG